LFLQARLARLLFSHESGREQLIAQ